MRRTTKVVVKGRRTYEVKYDSCDARLCVDSAMLVIGDPCQLWKFPFQVLLRGDRQARKKQRELFQKAGKGFWRYGSRRCTKAVVMFTGGDGALQITGRVVNGRPDGFIISWPHTKRRRRG
jgi:hypothetical protein